MLRLVLIYLVLFALLYFAVRNAPLADIWNSLRQLRLWQIGIIFVLNAVVVVAIALRWWAIVRADNPGVPVLPLIGYRLSVFGLSYFTPGPQVGGEPLQVYYLHRNHGVTSVRGTAAVIMDKLLSCWATSSWCAWVSLPSFASGCWIDSVRRRSRPSSRSCCCCCGPLSTS